MSRKYTVSRAIPTKTLAKRLEELSEACAAKMENKPEVFEREFTFRIPAELDRDPDLVLSESSRRLLELESEVTRLRNVVLDMMVEITEEDYHIQPE